MADSAHEAAREWVGDQLRYPQRLPRTAIVVNWSSVPQPVQRRLEEVVRAGGSIDYSSRLPRRRWWHGRGSGLSADEVRVVESAATSLRWPATLDNDETRLLTVVEGIVDRIATHPAWQHPVAYGHRSVVALHMELHDFAATTYELLQLRCATPEVPAHTDPRLLRATGMGSPAGRVRAQSLRAHRAGRLASSRRASPRPGSSAGRRKAGRRGAGRRNPCDRPSLPASSRRRCRLSQRADHCERSGRCGREPPGTDRLPLHRGQLAREADDCCALTPNSPAAPLATPPACHRITTGSFPIQKTGSNLQCCQLN